MPNLNLFFHPMNFPFPEQQPGKNQPHTFPSLEALDQHNTDPRIIHARALKSSHTDSSIFNNLITLYSKSKANLLSYSLRLFHQIPSPNIVSWTALISSHSKSPLSLHLFLSMLRYPILPNQRTLASLFKTCASLSHAFSFGLSLHSLSLKLCLQNKPFCGSALLNFYSRFRSPDSARKVFDEIQNRDEVCYAAMIVCFARNSRCLDSLAVFADMRHCYVGSTMYSVSGALRAAAELAALEQCRVVHAHAVVVGLDKNVIVGTALIDGYGKAGLVFDARRVFNENLSELSIVAWNAMMAGYAQQGDKNSVLQLFHLLKTRGFVPDEYSFLAVLTAFSNAGLYFESGKWMERMRIEYVLEPGLEHYTCLIGAAGRAGRLEDAERMAITMPFEPDAAVWRALLSSCAIHGAADMAWKIAQKLLELDPYDDSAYVIAANVLSSAGRWDEVAEVRKRMKDWRVKKEGGRSWIELKGKVHVFLAGDRRHDRVEEIYTKLKELMEECEKFGYVPIWDEMLHNVEEKEKKEGLWYHSERLALAFGLVSGSPPGKALRIVKNLRICRDCHECFKYISRVVEREIIVRDVNRYHRFLNGSCTCGDIW
ncbi:pentatricopeptide repeat-containing protein At4g33170-like [Mangifera indica]|uniref:pentatricopeptide repeat-containing protein At4g33170-like n=1 Tax=Mangifera indica TaxID=29780 RepID=UPI001CF94C7F|nr:pentatricopeptide repeat-containing protein At4g33170-like [Mangifera indica]